MVGEHRFLVARTVHVIMMVLISGIFKAFTEASRNMVINTDY